MDQERLNKLYEFLKSDPNDPFVLYAIANEYKDQEPDKAMKYFEQLLEEHQDYLPTYYHAADLWVKFGKPEEAKAIFEKGIRLAERKKDSLALRELNNSYQNFLFEQED